MVTMGQMVNSNAGAVIAQMSRAAREAFIKQTMDPIRASVETHVIEVKQQVDLRVAEKKEELRQRSESALDKNLHVISPYVSVSGEWDVGLGGAQASTASLILEGGFVLFGTDSAELRVGLMTPLTYDFRQRGNEINAASGGVIAPPSGTMSVVFYPGQNKLRKLESTQGPESNESEESSYDTGY